MCEHHSSSSPEDHPSDHETSSDTTLHEGEDELEWSTARRPSITSGSVSFSDDIDASVVFPFHLISACSSAGRIMCQYSGTVTAQETRKVLGLKGLWTRDILNSMH